VNADTSWRRIGFVLMLVGWGANHFAPLLPVYRQALGLDAAAPAALFGVYALGLMPGLLLAGPLSDRWGRRRLVIPAAMAALVVSFALGVFAESFAALLLGRFAYGMAAGAAMTPGAVWVAELSRDAGAGVGARRATISLTLGFGGGALASGVLAQFVPHPTLTPFLAHVALLALALVLARGVGDVGPGTSSGPLLRLALERTTWQRFIREVVPVTPFVFTFPTLAFTALPQLLPASSTTVPIAVTGVLSALTLGTGVLAQPLTRRFGVTTGAQLGLALGALGLVVGAVGVKLAWPAVVVVAAPLLGAAYGLCVTSGLRGVEAIAPPTARGGLTGVFYVLIYVGFASPFLVALAVRVLAPTLVLGLVAASALLSAGWLRLSPSDR
jgi:predicted MFS family arabinose efflux permease